MSCTKTHLKTKPLRPVSPVIVAAVLLVSLLAVTGIAQDQQAKPSYVDLLAKVKSGDRSANFKDLRLAYTETRGYSPYGGNRDARKAMIAAINGEKYEEALKQAENILAGNFMDINGHFGAFLANQKLGNTEKADHHKWVFQGLLKSITDSGDGKSAETAMVVISTDEEYAWFSFMGLRPSNQALVDEKRHFYDKMTTVNPKTNETAVFFFNIDKPYKWLANSLK